MAALNLYRISLRVAGFVRFSKDRTVYEIPYAGGKSSMKMEGKIPPASKEALAEIAKGFGGSVSYEPDGLKLEFPDKKAIEGFGEIQDLFKLDKKLRSIFDLKKKAEYPDDINEAVVQPKDRKPPGKAPVKEAPKAAPPQKAPATETPKPAPAQPVEKKETPSGTRRRPGPPPKAKFLRSLDRMSQVVQKSDDQQEIVDAVEDFLDGIRYDSWPESA